MRRSSFICSPTGSSLFSLVRVRVRVKVRVRVRVRVSGDQAVLARHTPGIDLGPSLQPLRHGLQPYEPPLQPYVPPPATLGLRHRLDGHRRVPHRRRDAALLRCNHM